MRVLTATSTTQGDRPDDCCWTTEGELVSLPVLECACPDCGCDRSFAGLDSHRATTTCVVADVAVDGTGLRRAVVRSLAAAGWLPDLDPDPPGAAVDVVETWDDIGRLVGPPDLDAALSALDRDLVDDVVTRILDVAGSFPPGTVLARADGGVVVRRAAATERVSG